MKCKAKLSLTKDSKNIIECHLQKGHGGNHRRQIDRARNVVVLWENPEDNWDEYLKK